MKKLSITLFAALLVLGMTIPALAEVNVYADIYKEKDIFVTVDVDIFKDVKFDVTVDLDLFQGAEADSIANQAHIENIVVGLADEEVADNNFRTAVIINSINTNTGIVGVNQDAGNWNNQGNIVSIAATVGGTTQLGFTNAQADAEQLTVESISISVEAFPVATAVQKLDLIDGSINGNSGIVGVNQSVGNMNNQLNQVVMAIGDRTAVAMSEADLGQTNAFNLVRELGTFKTDTIINSINNNTGVVGVNQSAGNMNNQANIVSISATR